MLYANLVSYERRGMKVVAVRKQWLGSTMVRVTELTRLPWRRDWAWPDDAHGSEESRLGHLQRARAAAEVRHD